MSATKRSPMIKWSETLKFILWLKYFNLYGLTSRHGCVKGCETGSWLGVRQEVRGSQVRRVRRPGVTVPIRPRNNWSPPGRHRRISPTLGFRSEILIMNFPDFATDFNFRVFYKSYLTHNWIFKKRNSITMQHIKN